MFNALQNVFAAKRAFPVFFTDPLQRWHRVEFFVYSTRALAAITVVAFKICHLAHVNLLRLFQPDNRASESDAAHRSTLR